MGANPESRELVSASEKFLDSGFAGYEARAPE
jgi:hypothetical protein